MKKLLIGLLAVLTMLALVACQKKEEVKPSGDVEPVVVEEITPAVVSGEAEKEQVGVGNTDEGMVALVLEDYIKNMYSGDVEEVTFKNIKVYSPAEISGEVMFEGLNIKEGDIPFEIAYDLKIREGVEDMIRFTVPNGEIEGQNVVNKGNLGILRSSENGYVVDNFGTGW